MKSTIAFAVLVAVSACGGNNSTPAAPTIQTPVAPACQSQNTAQLTMANGSRTNLTFDLLIDNISRGTMSPGQTLGPFTLTAGVNHTILSRVTNTSVTACTSTTSFAACSTQTLTCAS